MLFSLLSCVSKTNETAEPFVPLVNIDVQILDAMTGVKGGVTLLTDHSTSTTDTDGRASVLVSGNQHVSIRTQASNYMDHHIIGHVMEDDFSMVSLIASRSTTSQIYSMLGIEVDVGKGIVIVALDDPNLYPATGASAYLSSPHEGAFVFTATGVLQSNIVQSYGFVAFPNVDTGISTITVIPPANQKCWLHTGGAHSSTQNIEVFADQVTVTLFQCDLI